MKAIAVLDLGTNTFHLVITQVDQTGQKTIYRERRFVKLAADGIETLSHDAKTRGLAAIKHFMLVVSAFNVDLVKAVGTAALRTASNGPDFLEEIKNATALEVEIIDGIREAMLIYQGVKQVWKPSSQPALIMDIGGGSVEFILADDDQLLWADSFPVGVSVLHRHFHKKDPISKDEVHALAAFLQNELAPLPDQIKTYSPSLLVGASGTFDVIADMLGFHDNDYNEAPVVPNIMSIIQFIAGSTLAERQAHAKIPETRIDMIVVAVLLLKFTMEMGQFSRLGISSYALKEGLTSIFLE